MSPGMMQWNTLLGSPSEPAKRGACPPRRSGRKRRDGMPTIASHACIHGETSSSPVAAILPRAKNAAPLRLAPTREALARVGRRTWLATCGSGRAAGMVHIPMSGTHGAGARTQRPVGMREPPGVSEKAPTFGAVGARFGIVARQTSLSGKAPKTLAYIGRGEVGWHHGRSRSVHSSLH
jgi:hypothetical protein